MMFTYFKSNSGLTGEERLTKYMKVYAVIICLPGDSHHILQKLKEGPGSRSSTAGTITESNKGTVEQNVRAISWGIIIMLITYFVSRLHPYTDYVLSNFGLSKSSTMNG
ncbi:hypothetical protein FBUS_08750 [Fasciolopsis buskii]|uniref:Uncharacterized protein n=1 Tax=Fasciolopsis buskii TaxID=27845 RepID=A0A8E0VMJ7_9TREM|nr:hypothetical protein FBUS_08750 [Fasciolopsis buski]